MSEEEKKFLDIEGLKYLWTKISMNDYPNNEMLTAVIKAIDDTKADKTEIPDVSNVVKSVDGIQPLSNGNVSLNAVKTVNNTKPSSTGNVTVEVGVKTINSSQPDTKGNIDIQTAEVVIDDNGKLRNDVLPEGYPYRTGETNTPISKDFLPDDLITDSEVDSKIMASKSEILNTLDTEYATKEHVEQEIAMFDFIKVVDELPIEGFENRFYLVPKIDAETQDFFDEYVWVNKGTEDFPDWDWEWVTTKQVEVDLTNYTTLDKVEELILARSKKEHGIGTLYFSMVATNPAEILGFGTWSLIAKNSFLIGAGDKYTVGSTGGEEKHVLTAAELPRQNGTISTHGTYAGSPIAAVSGVFGARHTVSDKYMSGSANGHSSIDVIEYGNGGQDQPHNNLPPYIAVYIWQRIS